MAFARRTGCWISDNRATGKDRFEKTPWTLAGSRLGYFGIGQHLGLGLDLDGFDTKITEYLITLRNAALRLAKGLVLYHSYYYSVQSPICLCIQLSYHTDISIIDRSPELSLHHRRPTSHNHNNEETTSKKQKIIIYDIRWKDRVETATAEGRRGNSYQRASWTTMKNPSLATPVERVVEIAAQVVKQRMALISLQPSWTTKKKKTTTNCGFDGHVQGM